MYFDLLAFFRYNFRAFFKARNTHYHLTPKRILVLVIWLVLFIPAELINRICFLLDDILFPGYRKQEVQKPVFIIGNPRSGTTFLHRLMFKDKQTFTAFTVWELVLAPSITQRKIILAFVKMIKWAGYPISLLKNTINRRINFSKQKTAHAINIDEAEEDSHILIHSWTSDSLWAIYPFPDELLPYFFFDKEISKDKQRKVMKFYKSMIQRHLYAHGGNKILLSKNPSHTSKLAALLETFPDARFIDMVRTPFEAMPSMLDYMSIGWKLFCDPLELYPFKEEFFKVMNFYYLYPAEFFRDKENQCNFVKYEDLVEHPDEVVEDLYTWLELTYSNKFQKIVAFETNKAHQYRSHHEYSIEQMGLTEKRIFNEFEEVFSFYEFDNHHFDLPDHIFLWELKESPQRWKTQRKQRQYNRWLRRMAKRDGHIVAED